MLELIHAATTWMLAGLIWTIQLVHYPLLLHIGADRFAAYHRSHMLRTSMVVIPLASLEAVLAACLVVGSHRHDFLAWAGIILIGINAISTAAIHAPLHLRLKSERDESLLKRLILTNWIRTIAWSLRSVIALLLVKISPS